MPATLTKALAALLTLATLSACAPLLIGGGAAVVADEAIEQDQGGDGLF
jgi:predicted small lipoprotein YifL